MFAGATRACGRRLVAHGLPVVCVAAQRLRA
jgi:hypothetical protein